MTENQLRTLDNIRAFYDAHGRGPGIRELMAIEGLKSTSGIHTRIQTLVKYGYLRKLDDYHGRYVPVEAPVEIDLRPYPTQALEMELQRRGKLAADVKAQGRST